jgi:hypothetical protein
MTASPYAAFSRHLSTAAPAKPLPQPVDPVTRITIETLARLTAIEDALAQSHIEVMAHFPDTVRLKLSKLLLATAERCQLTRSAVALFAAHGTLTPPPGSPPRKKPRARP